MASKVARHRLTEEELKQLISSRFIANENQIGLAQEKSIM
jgi:hypothetical protein